MKLLNRRLTTCVVALSPVFGVSFADAPSKTETTDSSSAMDHRYAIVDMQTAILQTNEGKAARAKIEQDAEQKKKQLMTAHAELKKLAEDFNNQLAVLTEADKMKKHQELATKEQAFQQAKMNLTEETRQKEMEATQKIYQGLMAITSKISAQKGYTFVFEKGSGALLYAKKIDDLTQEVVNQYNATNKVAEPKKTTSAKK